MGCGVGWCLLVRSEQASSHCLTKHDCTTLVFKIFHEGMSPIDTCEFIASHYSYSVLSMIMGNILQLVSC